MFATTKGTSDLHSETLVWGPQRVVGLLLILLLLPCGPVLAQEEDGEAIPYAQLKAQANLEGKAAKALEAAAKSSGSLKNGKFNITISVRFDATQQQLNTWKEQFQDASELLYDATDGQLQFGTIHICDNSRGGKNADIWIHKGSGRSFVPGGCVPGLEKDGCHVNLYADDITQSNANADGAWTITHEWGHYALGIFDEYVTDPPKSGAICQIPRTYQAPDPPANSNGSLMENYWLRDITEFCVSSNHDLDNPTTASDEGGDTWQEDVHGESAWETLASNFSSVSLPSGLPNQAAPSGHDPIDWQVLEPETRLSLIIDESGSMSGSNIQNARNGAKLFVDLTGEGDKLGVGSFDTNARTVFSMTEVTASSKANAKSAIDGITAGGSTNIGGGLLEGLDQIVNAGDPACQQTIILLSDGAHNTGTNPLNVIPDLNAKNITVNAIALGSAANTAPLRKVAEETGGKLFFATSPSDLASVFAKLRTQTTENGGIITAASSPVDPGQVVTQGVDVESGMQEATFLINWGGSADVDLTLQSPSGATITPSSASDPDIGHTEESNSEFYTVQTPEAGEWTMRIAGAGANTSTVDVSAQASGVSPNINFQASPSKVDVDFPDPVRIKATAQAPVTVTGATVKGTVTRPDGSTVSIDLVDDGTGGDIQADDGIYTVLFDKYNEEGAYNFEITATTGSIKRAAINGKAASTSARLFRGEALFTEEAANGNIDAVPPSGPSDTPAPVFTRTETFSANVGNVPANFPPDASGDSYGTPEDQPLEITQTANGVLGNDSDREGDPLSVSVVSDPSSGSLTLNNDGTFIYTPNDNFNGSDSFTYQVADGNGGTDQATVSITVSAVNDAPTVTTNTGLTLGEGATKGITTSHLDASDVDDPRTNLTFKVSVAPSNGTLLVNGSKADSFTPADLDRDRVSYRHDGSETESDRFKFELTDNSGGQTKGRFGITVEDDNDPPQVANAIADQSLLVDGTFERRLMGVFDDSEEQSLSFEASSDNSSVADASVSDARLKVSTKSAGTATITVTATDDDGAKGQDDFSLEVKESGAPVAVAVANVSAGELVGFGETGGTIDFSSGKGGATQASKTSGPDKKASGSGQVTVKKFDNAPRDPQGIPEASVSKYRFVIESDGDLSVGTGTNLHLDVSTLGGIDSATDVTVYMRSEPGTGVFGALQTTYDTDANELVAGLSGFGEFALGSGTQPLPVELAEFSATRTESSVLLKWQTASETDNTGFDVQHQSPDGKEWKTLGFVESKASGGTTTEPQTYRYEVEDPKPGTHRFRLQQVDTDGTTHRLETVSMTVQMEEALRLTAPAPNPVRTGARIRFGVREVGEVTVHLYNVLGQQMATLYEGTPTPGQMETIQLGEKLLSQLPSGVYFVRLEANGKVRTRRMTIAK